MNSKYTRGPFAHPSHREFNERFEDKIPDSNVVERPWMSNRTLENLPVVANDFRRARDPFVAKQLDDLGKTEAQRRGEAARQSGMVTKDRPEHNLRPPRDIAQESDARTFSLEWLREQRDAALDQARRYEDVSNQLDVPEHTYHRAREPDREPGR